MSQYGVKRGELVEFTREHVQHYDGKDALFGVATEDERPDGSVEVEMGDGTKQVARHIHSYAWGGWIPEELEDVYDKYMPEEIIDWEDDFDGF